MKKYFKITLWTFLALTFVGTFVYLYRKSRPEKEVWEELTPEIADISRTAVITGKIVPRDEVNVKAQIGGIISEIYKEPGQTVTAGEVIAKVGVVPDMQSLSAAQSRVRLAQINLTQAEINCSREKNLREGDLVSAEEYEKALQALEQAKEEFNAAEEALEVVKTGVSRSNASSSSTLIRSTISGLILDIPVKVGNSVVQSNTFNDGTTIATVADMGNLIFDGNVDETEVGTMEVGTPVTITIGAIRNLTFDAILEYISPKAVDNNGSQQFQVKAAVSIPDSVKVRSGYSANARIILERVEKVLSLPEKAVRFDGDSTFVEVVKSEDEFERRAVQTGLSDGVTIEIRTGLGLEEKVRGNKVNKSK